MSREIIPASDRQLRRILGVMSLQLLRLAEFPEFTVDGIAADGVPIIPEDVAWSADLIVPTRVNIATPYRRTLGMGDRAELVYVPLHTIVEEEGARLARPEVALFIDEPIQPNLRTLTYRIKSPQSKKSGWKSYRHEEPLQGADYDNSSSRRISYGEAEALLAVAVALASLPNGHFATGEDL
jgi:hypothetical protein